MDLDQGAPSVQIDDGIPRWLVVWIVVLVITCIAGWFWYGGEDERVFRHQRRSPEWSLAEAIVHLTDDKRHADRRWKWRTTIPVDRRVHIEINAYTLIDGMVAYGGTVAVAPGEDVVRVDLQRLLTARGAVAVWWMEHGQDQSSWIQDLPEGQYGLVILVDARRNWHGVDLNPYRPPAGFDRSRFIH